MSNIFHSLQAKLIGFIMVIVLITIGGLVGQNVLATHSEASSVVS